MPAQIIGKFYENVSGQTELGGGDIRNILDVLDLAISVQNDRLDSDLEDSTGYASEFSEQNVKMLGDLLSRPR